MATAAVPATVDDPVTTQSVTAKPSAKVKPAPRAARGEADVAGGPSTNLQADKEANPAPGKGNPTMVEMAQEAIRNTRDSKGIDLVDL